jgi:hypothetical protein
MDTITARSAPTICVSPTSDQQVEIDGMSPGKEGIRGFP